MQNETILNFDNNIEGYLDELGIGENFLNFTQ